jgi:hypothetical protein
VYLSAYHFDGDPTDLTARYDRMAAHFPDEELLLHACVVTDRGISVYDACPSRQVHAEFVASAAWQGALADAGLTPPRLEDLGDVHHWAAARVPTP